MNSARIFDVKRFGVNDGRGIRTVLFMKGCPLRCRWCQNPEGLTPGVNVWHARSLCVGCHACVAACRHGAIAFDEAGALIDSDSCTRCGDCVRACPTGALRFDARIMTVDEALEEVLRDEVFYRVAGGGVTLSGGDPVQSPEFSLGVLKACRDRGIDTAVETCLHAGRDVVGALAELSDEVIADIKLIDPVRHRAATGADNALILDNIRRLARRKTRMRLRTPLIPGFTADRENIEGIARFISSLGAPVPWELINFNPMCRDKYASLRLKYEFDPALKPYSEGEMRAFRTLAEAQGLRVL